MWGEGAGGRVPEAERAGGAETPMLPPIVALNPVQLNPGPDLAFPHEVRATDET